MSQHHILAFDTETPLIEPGKLAPGMVCLQWVDSGDPARKPSLAHRDHAYNHIRMWLEGDDILVGHNVAYDMAVIGAQWPDLLPLIFRKYDRDQVTDTKLREQIIMIARGTFKFQTDADGEAHKVGYSLAECCLRHFQRPLKKEGFRLFYRAFDEHPDVSRWAEVARVFQASVRNGNPPEWFKEYMAAGLIGEKDVAGMLAARPEEAEEYALADGTTTLEVYESQEKYFGHLLADQYRQARAAFALHLTSAWGVHTDPYAVDALETDLRERFHALQAGLQAAGIVREDGTADTKAAQAAMVLACEEEGIPVPMTKGGKKPRKDGTISPPQVSLSAEYCEQFDEDTTIGRYSAFLTLRKTLSADIKMLHGGCEVPIHPRYDLADTGRTTCSGPNIQAINRGAGIREAFRPREGTVFAQADYEGLELHTRAVWCLEKIGWSKLADDLNAGLDVHSVVAADLLGCTYEEVKAGLKSSDTDLKKRCKDARQSAKALNFGLPGGLGVKKFCRYAKNNYGVDLDEAQAKRYKAQWMGRQPEVVDFFASAAQLTANPSKLGDEETLFTGRQATNMRYSALCNRRFQALGGDAAKAALYRVVRACYIETDSPLFGCRPVAFIHDEIILEAPADHRAAPAAKELGRLMCAVANELYLGKVPVRTEPLLMTQWSKKAEPSYDSDGQLIPWAPKAA